MIDNTVSGAFIIIYLEDHGKPLCSHHPMESSNKDSLLGIEPRRRALHIVGVGDHPRNDLNLRQKKKKEMLGVFLVPTSLALILLLEIL